MRLAHNLASLNIYKSYTKATSAQSRAINNISSGYKVSSAKDNPNVIAQSEKIKIQIRGLQMAGKNMQDGISMLQTAEGGLDNMTSMLQRIRELTLQSANGTNSTSDKAAIQNEIDQLIEGYDDIASNTEFNGTKLLKNGNSIGNNNTLKLETVVGANSDEKVKIPYYNLTSTQIPVVQGSSASRNCLADLKSNGSINIADNDISKGLEVIDSSLNSIVSVRSKYGALENRLDSTYYNVGEISEKMEGADSVLVDADIAEEMMNYSRASILSEAGNAMMAQTNKFSQDILGALSNVRSK